MGKNIERWRQKSERTLGNQRGQGIFFKMLSEQDKTMFKGLLAKRIPRPDNTPSKDELDLI